MAWIEAQQSLRDHPKTKRMARTLGISRPEAIGHLFCLWWWALDYADDGDLRRHDVADIADGADWGGDPKQFQAALQTAGFLDPNGHLHNWDCYGGKYIKERDRGKVRQRAYRAEKQKQKDAKASGNADVTRDNPVTNADVTRDSAVTNGLSRVSHTAENSTRDMTLFDARTEDARTGDEMPPDATPPDAQGSVDSEPDSAPSLSSPSDSERRGRTENDWGREDDKHDEIVVSTIEASSETPAEHAAPPASYWTDEREDRYERTERHAAERLGWESYSDREDDWERADGYAMDEWQDHFGASLDGQPVDVLQDRIDALATGDRQVWEWHEVIRCLPVPGRGPF